MSDLNKVSLEFRSYADAEFDSFAGRIVTSMTKNEAFPNPPVSAVDLGKKASVFHSALQASLEGGLQLTTAKNDARLDLERALRQMAKYVESMAGTDVKKLQSSGFYVLTATHRGSLPLPTPIMTLVQDRGTTRLRIKMARIPNARSYQVQYGVNGNGGWQDGGVFLNTRDMVLQNLTPGTTYNVRVRAFGGSTGSSDWSDPTSKMAI